MVINNRPLYYLRTNPKSWTRASLRKFQAAAQAILQQTTLGVEKLQILSWAQRHEHLRASASLYQESMWEATTGIKPVDAHFTLIIPIHNEEHSLLSFLSTLMLADLPATLDMTIIFVTNACDDSSPLLLDSFLANLGTLETRRLQGTFTDRLLDTDYKAVQMGGITLMHVDTKTPGKGHALRTGNSIAYANGHIIAMCIDANDYIEPDAIRTMFAAAYKNFRSEPTINDTVILSGIGNTERRGSKYKKLIDTIESRRQHLLDDTSGYILGCLMSWNTAWLQNLGDPLGIALEDYAMGVLARAHRYKIGQVPGAIIWSYGVNVFGDLLETRSRYVRGMLQLLHSVHYAPATVRIVEQDSFYMRNLQSRLHHLLLRSRQNPLNSLKYFATFLLWECAIARGKRDFQQNPYNPSWKKIASTR